MANNLRKVIWAPKYLELNNLTTFIRVFNFIFDMDGKEKPYVHLAFGKVVRCDATGALLLYKILEYTVSKRCFRSPTHDIAYNDYLKTYIAEYGFQDLIKSLMNNPNDVDLRPYKKLRISSDKKILIAPIALIRDDTIHSIDIIKNQYVPIISSFYDDEKTQKMILDVFTEVMHNFWAHATADDKSIIVGYGTKQIFEIVCCDNGMGIDGTMRECYSNKDSKILVKRAMENGITSKANTSHMGFGLWYINKVVTETQGSLLIVSNDVVYRNSYGKINVSNGPLWKGCIVSVKIPLANPVTISDMDVDISQEVKINFI